MKNRKPYHLGSRIVRLFSCWVLVFTLAAKPSHSQTPISGIVNTYYSVVGIDAPRACLVLNTTSGLNYNDKVMVIQMKGASINTSNSASFGDTVSLNNAGNYEIATVCHTIDDSLFLVFMLQNQYTVSGKVQVVKIPQYNAATVVDTLKAAPWNNATGRGGVLAVIVENDLTLNAPVYADSSGFRGGAYRLSSGTCSNFFPSSDYYYDANNVSPQDGSFKGEGVADIASGMSGGRGAPANGGGGGNNHNNGGGGGANISAGGMSGGNSSSVGCRVNIAGLGGKALSSHAGTKIFPGGGGGAGHSNFNLANATGGGNGGGIVFIQANNIIGNNRKISANGRVGGASLGDGASGGGAGGTIIIDAGNFTGPMTIEANGGQGGTSNDGGNVGRCYGAGGGGGGGIIYFTGTTPAVTVNTNAGAAGPEIGREASCNPVIPAVAGNAGQVVQNYDFISSNVLMSSYCGMLLPVELVWFRVSLSNEMTVIKWKVAESGSAERFIIERKKEDGNWTMIEEVPALESMSHYQVTDAGMKQGNNFYRLKMIGKNNEASYSPVQKVYVPASPETIRIYPNPASNKIHIQGLPANTELAVCDGTGKIIFKQQIHTSAVQQVDLAHVSPGVYILKAGNVARKIIVR